MTTTVTLSPEQDEIRGVARSFLEARYPSDRVRELMKTPAGFEQSDWDEIAELGWTGIAVPEGQGGAGYSDVERCLLLEEMGRVLFPCPFLSSAVLAADALALAGEGGAAAELLPGVVDGSTRATLVAGGDLGAGQGSALRAVARGEEHELSGNGGLTLDGHTGELLIVVAALEGGELALFAVDPGAEGVIRNPVETIDETRKTAVVEFERTPAHRLDGGDGGEGIALALDRGAVALAAEMAGGARKAIEMTVAYMHEREQFGGPIGRFQALKHRLADLHVRIDVARQSVYAAADALAAGESEHVPMLAAAAKYAASIGYVTATAEAIQLHGGIGFTEEHDIGLYYKRALVSAETLGAPADQVERIALGLDV
ncbi:MAG TPA: acyl-CoA dehydrogenase family protein [Solirubrobacterales bacterium]|nr:acyl-CoA dehydrogenase family protein [Solirubrobacterales bacterium]